MLVVALVLVTVPFAVNRLRVNRNISRAQLPWKHATRNIEGRSLVFVRRGGYLLFLDPFSANDPDLSRRILFATDKGAPDLDLIHAHPDRTPYLERTSIPLVGVPTAFPHMPTVTVTRMRLLRGGVVSLQMRVRVPRGYRAVVASLQVGDRVLHRTLATHARSGSTYETEWQGAAAGTSGAPASVPLTARLGTVTLSAGWGNSPKAARRRPAVRQQFGYRLDDATVEVLLPQEKARMDKVYGRRQWRSTYRLPALRVVVTSRAVGP